MVEKNEWWKSVEWRKIRKECLSRDRYACRGCGVHHKHGKNLTAHHIQPREEGGGDNLENLLTLCPTCHDLVEGRGLRTVAEIVGICSEPQAGEWTAKPWYPGVYGGEELDTETLCNQVAYLLDENERLSGEVEDLGQKVAKLQDTIADLEAEIDDSQGEIMGSSQRPRKLDDHEREIAERVLALYGQPGLETWAKVGKRLRVSRGSAYSLAHGLRKPDPRILERLALAEWGIHHLPSAVANLRKLRRER